MAERQSVFRVSAVLREGFQWWLEVRLVGGADIDRLRVELEEGPPPQRSAVVGIYPVPGGQMGHVVDHGALLKGAEYQWWINVRPAHDREQPRAEMARFTLTSAADNPPGSWVERVDVAVPLSPQLPTAW